MDPKCEVLLEESIENCRHWWPLLINRKRRAIVRRDATVTCSEFPCGYPTLVLLWRVDALEQAEGGWRWVTKGSQELNCRKVVAKATGSQHSSLSPCCCCCHSFAVRSSLLSWCWELHWCFWRAPQSTAEIVPVPHIFLSSTDHSSGRFVYLYPWPHYLALQDGREWVQAQPSGNLLCSLCLRAEFKLPKAGVCLLLF